jgi:hypothetical protein
VRDLIKESATNPALAVREPRAQYLLKPVAKTTMAATPASKRTVKKTQTSAEKPTKEMSFLEFMRASPWYGIELDLTRDKRLPRDINLFDE